MGSLDDAMVRAEKLGRQAADKERAVAAGRGTFLMAGLRRDRRGGTVGSLALNAFREHGEDGMKTVFKGYQAGYNGWADGLALRAATAEEEAA